MKIVINAKPWQWTVNGVCAFFRWLDALMKIVINAKPWQWTINGVRAFFRWLDAFNAGPAKWTFVGTAPFLAAVLQDLAYNYSVSRDAAKYLESTELVLLTPLMLLQTYLCARTVFERRFDVGAIFCKFIATYSFLVTFLMFNRVAKLGKLLKPILDYFIWIVAW